MRAPLRRAHSLPLPCAAHPAASARIPSSALHHTLRRAARIRSSFLCRAPLRKATHSLPFVRPALRISPRHAHSLRPPYAVTPPLRRAFPSSTLRRHLAASARIPSSALHHTLRRAARIRSSALRRASRRFGAHPLHPPCAARILPLRRAHFLPFTILTPHIPPRHPLRRAKFPARHPPRGELRFPLPRASARRTGHRVLGFERIQHPRAQLITRPLPAPQPSWRQAGRCCRRGECWRRGCRRR